MPRHLMIPMTLQYLPIEVICQIFTYLDMLDLLACSMVTKHLRKIILESSQLQYIIELGKHRMVPTVPPTVGPSFHTRLKLLRERERAWKYLDWKKKDTLKLPPTGSVYEFVGGLYGNGREDDGRITAAITFLELPSTNSPSQDQEMWTHSMGDITIVDFTMDPSQDLLVLVALAPADSRYIYELHLRSIKTNLPHPKAPMPVLSCLRKPTLNHQASDTIAAVRVQVAGDLLALLIKEAVEGTTAHLEIWNWVTSPQFSSAMGRADGIDDFTFLNDHSFLLVLPPGQFEVYSFSDLTKSSNAPVLRVTYAFPPLSDGYLYWYITMSSNPAPGYVPYSSNDDESSTRKSQQLYYPEPNERIHACCLYVYNPSNDDNFNVQTFVFFVNLQSLINPPEEWFAKPQSPHQKPAQRRQPGDRSYPAAGHSSIPSPMNAFSPGRLVSTPHPSASAPTSSNTEQGSSLTGASSSKVQPLHLYPPFPTFDSRPSSPNGHGLSSSNSTLTQPNGVSKPSNRRRRATRPVTTLSDKAYTVPWEVWGPQSTRWFEETVSTDWQHAVYGLRAVESLDPSRHGNLPIAVEESAGPDSAHLALESPSPPEYISVGVQTGSPTNITTTPPASPTTMTSDSLSDTTNGVASSSPASGSSLFQVSASQSAANLPQNGSQEDADRSKLRFLRLRDFNPYLFDCAADPVDKAHSKGKGRAANDTPRWRRPRLVTEPSTTPVKGVFKKDIVSSLPYMEIISAEEFNVTDVMMDDCRLLLLKRGDTGKLHQVDVLML